MALCVEISISMMAQNRQNERDRLNASYDYEVNRKAEMEIVGLHTKVDVLREQQ